jgi:four helix bundle protein
MILAKDVYALTKKFPKEELYGLTSQMRRASVPVPSNIAEGSQRISDKEFSNFILIAKGSLAELITQAVLARDLHFLKEEDLEAFLTRANELLKMLYSFHKKLTANS